MTLHSPRTVEQAVALLEAHPSAMILSGGTDFMVEVNFNHRKPSEVVSTRAIDELKSWSINRESDTVFVGAGVTYGTIENSDIARVAPALAEASRTVGSPQIRAAGTIGGNLGTCSPAGDTLPVLAALEATIHLASSTGRRQVSFADFMVGPKKNSLLPGEMVLGVTLPIVDGWQGYAKVGVRNAMVISIASACLVRRRSDDAIRVALGSVGPTIIRTRASESWWLEQDTPRISSKIAAEFGTRCAAEASPITDHRSTAEYRRHAVKILCSRLAERSASR
jgi:CO/xanthine dehydrogenase FAD-binding subunit